MKNKQEKVNFNSTMKKEALKAFLKYNWLKIVLFLAGYFGSVFDMNFYKYIKIMLININEISQIYFWISYIITIIFTYFLLKIYVKLFIRPSLDLKAQKNWHNKVFAGYIIICMGYFVGVIVDVLVEYLQVGISLLK